MHYAHFTRRGGKEEQEEDKEIGRNSNIEYVTNINHIVDVFFQHMPNLYIATIQFVMVKIQ